MEPKNNTAKYVAGIVLIAIVIIVVSLLGNKQSSPTIKNTPTTPITTASENQRATTATDITTQSVVEVDYTDQGFVPASVTIKQGEAIKFVNKTSDQMWVGSAMHPSHIIYSGTALKDHCPDTLGTAFDQCQTGNEFSFTFDKIGSWGYHNHVVAGKYGKIVVVAK